MIFVRRLSDLQLQMYSDSQTFENPHFFSLNRMILQTKYAPYIFTPSLKIYSLDEIGVTNVWSPAPWRGKNLLA